MADTPWGIVSEIWRYPVKSMLGERMDAADVGELGVAGDRAYGVLDVARGAVLSAKREPGLFACSARYENDGVAIRLPDATELGPGGAADAALTELIGRPARLVAAAHMPRARLVGEIDPPEGEPSQWDAPAGTFFDASPLHLLTTATLREYRFLYPEGDFDPRRFRSNFVIDTPEAHGFAEEDLIGKSIRIGDVEVRITKPCSRCVMTSHAQGELPPDPGILRTIARQHDNNLGVRAVVARGGRVQTGDAVTLSR